jgi:glycolate oxidase FAD binding subunit
VNDLNANPSAVVYRPTSLEAAVAFVREHSRVQVIGASTKSAMTKFDPSSALLGMTGLSGVIEHQPSEFLITAAAGTTLSKLQEELNTHQQYLPFDPPFVTQGATIGGTVAAGLSGAGRLRFGGLRDFIVGIKIIDGLGNVVTGGGRVVKNAAGYDLPKLMVGSAGHLGLIIEVTLKVFPKPTHERTVGLDLGSLEQALRFQHQLSRSPIELAAIDLMPDGMLWIRIEGESAALETTMQRIQKLLQMHSFEPALLSIVKDGDSVWRPLADGSFAVEGDRLVRVPVMPSQIMAMDFSLNEMCVARRYSAAGNVAWIAWPSERPIQQLDECLRHHRMGGTVLRGDVVRYRIGVRPSGSMTSRVKNAIDPSDRFVGCP